MAERTKAISVQLVHDEHVIVTRYEFTANAETGWHRHQMDYVVVAITDCHMLIEDSEGTRTFTISRGEAYSRPSGIMHNVVNAGKDRMVFVETELKNVL